MKDEYDFSKGVRNPFHGRLPKKTIMTLSNETMEFFEQQAKDQGIAYQTLINYYLEECAKNNRKIEIK